MMFNDTRVFALALAMSGLILGTTDVGSQAPPPAEVDSLLLRGIAVDVRGPLPRKTVIVLLLNSEGKPVTVQAGAQSTLSLEASRANAAAPWRYFYTTTGDSRLGPRLNPQVTTDARGAFAVRVTRSLLARSKDGQLALAVFDGATSDFEPEIVEVAPGATTVDVGRLIFKPVDEPKR